MAGGRARHARCCCSWRRRSPACASASRTTATTPRARRPARPTTGSPRASAPGFNGPLVLAAKLPPGGGEAALERVQRAVAADPGVASVAPGAAQRGRRRRHARRDPGELAAGRADVRAGRAAPWRRGARRRARIGRRGVRRRRDRDVRGARAARDHRARRPLRPLRLRRDEDRPQGARPLRQAARGRAHLAGPGPGAGQPARGARDGAADRGSAAARLLRQREHAGHAGGGRTAAQRLARWQRRDREEAVEPRCETARRRRRSAGRARCPPAPASRSRKVAKGRNSRGGNRGARRTGAGRRRRASG